MLVPSTSVHVVPAGHEPAAPAVAAGSHCSTQILPTLVCWHDSGAQSASLVHMSPGFFAGGWNVLLAPTGTPDAIIRKANADLRKALDDQSLRDRLATMGSYLRSMSPEEVTAFAQEQQRTWRPIAEEIAKQAAEQLR